MGFRGKRTTSGFSFERRWRTTSMLSNSWLCMAWNVTLKSLKTRASLCWSGSSTAFSKSATAESPSWLAMISPLLRSFSNALNYALKSGWNPILLGPCYSDIFSKTVCKCSTWTSDSKCVKFSSKLLYANFTKSLVSSSFSPPRAKYMSRQRIRSVIVTYSGSSTSSIILKRTRFFSISTSAGPAPVLRAPLPPLVRYAPAPKARGSEAPRILDFLATRLPSSLSAHSINCRP